MSVDGNSVQAHSGVLPVAALVAFVAMGVSPSRAPPAREHRPGPSLCPSLSVK